MAQIQWQRTSFWAIREFLPSAARARDQFAALLPISERVLGPEHPDALSAGHELACWTEQAAAATPDAR